MNATITLREYLEKGKTFVVPNYQRGYVWGKKRPKDDRDSVSYMLDSLLDSFRNNTEVFIQGVTVSETEEWIVLIDGQQRTTFFYLLLNWLDYKEPFRLEYAIRKQSNDFLGKIKEQDIEEDKDEEYQDIYFFKKTLRIVRDRLTADIDREAFLKHVLDRVKFLYIDIPEEKATTVFTMMNGNKAEMQEEELIKAELLRLASLNDSFFARKEDKEKYAIEWDNNMLRSRYAREWDKWLQWWNRDEVRKLFKTENVMGLLIETYQRTVDEENKLSYARFKDKFLKEEKPIVAKKTFDGLRRMQKGFEDAFNNPITYNKVGAIIRVINDKDKFIDWYFGQERRSGDELDYYYRRAFLGMTHKEIVDKNEEAFIEKFNNLYKQLVNDDLYNKNPEAAFRLLLRLNIDEDNLQEEGKGREFDFSIWDRKDSCGRSLEHIYPKSKVLHEEEIDGKIVKKKGDGEIIEDKDIDDTFILRKSCRDGDVEAGEHSIGNLVLLYKDDNSTFNNSSFEDKKGIFFKKYDAKHKDFFKSRHLLHTIYKFANSKWDGVEIAKNKRQTLEGFRNYYGK